MHVVRCIHIMASVPAPAPAPDAHVSVYTLQTIIILLSVYITLVLLLFLFFLGRIRRSVSGRRILKNATKISYFLVPISITYIMGVLHKDPAPHVLSPVWTGALIYAYGGVVTVTACDLKDNDETLRYAGHMLPLFFWTIWMGFVISSGIEYRYLPALVCTHVFFLVSAMINTRQTLEAFYHASKSKGLPHLAEPIVRYMDELGSEGDMADPTSMRGYGFVVWGNPALVQDITMGKKITTIDEIWKWVPTSEEETRESTSLGGKKQFLAKCVGKDRLRDICLSYALFRMLLTRFAGFPAIRDVNPIRQRRLIQEGLLSKEPQHMERAFRVIEVELDFLFDFFYTKSHVCGSYRFRDSWQHLVQILLHGFFAAFGIQLIVHTVKTHIIRDDAGSEQISTEDDPALTVTRVVIFIFVLLESCKYIMVHFSNRKIVWLLCTAIREATSNDMWASTTELRIVVIWTIKHFLIERCGLVFFYFFKPWQRKLGQYSFLESYGRVPLFACKLFSPLARIVKLPRAGQRGDSIVSLSKEVKQAIVSSLVENHELKLSRGTNTLARYGLAKISSDACQLKSDARFILVWHIATSFCESLHPIQRNIDPDHGHFLAATQLSKYCAYLLTFAPELLPDHPYTTERLFDKSVQQAKDCGMHDLNIDEQYQNLITKKVDINDNLVVKGALLARELADQVIQNPNQGWRVLAEFWAEVLLYLAPSDDVGVHGEYLARGGEFITHLWALLTHAGVLTRESSSSTI